MAFVAKETFRIYIFLQTGELEMFSLSSGNKEAMAWKKESKQILNSWVKQNTDISYSSLVKANNKGLSDKLNVMVINLQYKHYISRLFMFLRFCLYFLHYGFFFT